jgi:ribonuclease HI
MVHIVIDGGVRPNPSQAGWRTLVKPNKAFTMMWKRYPRATNNTMEFKAVTEALRGFPEGMIV